MSSFHILAPLRDEAMTFGRSSEVYGVHCRRSKSGQAIWYENGCRASWEEVSRSVGAIWRAINRPLNETFLCGRPFYCKVCGAGLGEWLECDGECELESAKVAEERLRAAHVLLALNKKKPAINGSRT